jgi:hypothetical protein
MLKAWLFRPIGPLAPLGWLIAGVATFVTFAFLAAAWSRIWAWLPWSAEQRLGVEIRRADTAESAGLSATLQSEGQAGQIDRIETAGRLTIDVQTATAHAVQQAQEAPDATERLSPDRADRLRALDSRLCDLRPAVCAATAPDPAPTGD